MEKKIFSLLVLLAAMASASAQVHYGPGSGVLGANNSFFGWLAGALVSGDHNTFVGAKTGSMPGVGTENPIVGSHAFYSNVLGSSNSALGAHVRIYNLEGKELKNIQVDERGAASIKISANDLSAGMYLYALIVDGKVVDTKRLILTR